jgi:hypothetical protein
VNKLFNLLSLLLFVYFVLFPTSKVLSESQESPLLNWQLNIKWKDVPLSDIPSPHEKINLKSGKVDISFTISNSGKGTSYKAEGNIIDGVVYVSQWKEEINNIEGGFILKDNNIEITSLKGNFRDIPLTAEGQIGLDSPYPFKAKITAKDVTVDGISPLFPFIEPHVGPYKKIKTKGEMDFVVDGVLPPGPFEGKLILQEASLYSMLMNNVEISFIWHDNKVIVKNISANLSEGKISGEGEIIINQK